MNFSISMNIGNFVKTLEYLQSFWNICYPYSRILSINNTINKEVFKGIYDKLQSNTEKYGVKRINGFYMSMLEHEWIIMVEANSAHDIEHLCIDSCISSLNTVKIVPLTNYQDVVSKLT